MSETANMTRDASLHTIILDCSTSGREYLCILARCLVGNELRTLLWDIINIPNTTASTIANTIISLYQRDKVRHSKTYNMVDGRDFYESGIHQISGTCC